MLRPAIGVLCAILAMTGPGRETVQNTPGPIVQIKPRFVPGDAFTLDFTRSIDQRMGETSGYEVKFAVRVTVISTDAAGSVLEWRPGLPDGKPKGMPEIPDWRMLFSLNARANHAFRLELDSRGQYRRTTNIAELTPSLERAREQRLAAVADSGWTGVIAQLRALTGAHIASTAGDDAEIFTALYGLESSVGQPLQQRASFPMPGGPAPGTRQFRIETATAAEVQATMSFTLERPIPQQDRPGEARGRTMDLKEDGQWTFDRHIGLHSRGTFDRTATSRDDKRIEHWSFTMTVPPKRK